MKQSKASSTGVEVYNESTSTDKIYQLLEFQLIFAS